MDNFIAKVKELSKNKNYVIGAAVAAVVIIALVLFLVFRSTPEKAINQFMEAFAKGDSEKMIDVIWYDDDDHDADDTEERIEEFCESIADEDVTITYKIGNVKESSSGKTAKVKVKVKMEKDDDEEKETLVIPLKKVDGKWKVNYYKIDND